MTPIGEAAQVDGETMHGPSSHATNEQYFFQSPDIGIVGAAPSPVLSLDVEKARELAHVCEIKGNGYSHEHTTRDVLHKAAQAIRTLCGMVEELRGEVRDLESFEHCDMCGNSGPRENCQYISIDSCLAKHHAARDALSVQDKTP